MKKIARSVLLVLLACSLQSCGGGGSGDDEAAPTPVAEATQPPAGRIWTVAEILAEPRMGGSGRNVSCGGEFGFKRCVCAPDVVSDARYRPSVLECNGNAAAILSGNLLNIFSVVVRDTQNRDRWPEAGSGFGGCSAEVAGGDAPPNACSAFKVQDSFEIGGGVARVYCFGASGYSDLFTDVVRMTIKITDSPFSNDDEIERYCLNSGRDPLN